MSVVVFAASPPRLEWDRGYKELFEKKAEDIGNVRRDCEKI